MSAEIVGPFHRRELVVEGWTVPFVEAIELDGGRIHFVVDHRFGYDVAAADFEQVAGLLADAVAIALGMPSHPRGDLTADERRHWFAHLSHGALRPVRLIGITAVSTEQVDDDGASDEEQSRP